MFKCRVVPLVLPLSVVLPSMAYMTAENYELAAMNRPHFLQYFQVFSRILLNIAAAALISANNVIPYAEYKSHNFRRNIAR
jgi:lipopolysaccharide export system permease protein